MTNEKFNDLYETVLINPGIYPGALIKGKVVNINSKFVTINAFLKSDGYIPVSQFRNEKGKVEIKINSEVEVVIDYLEDMYGDVRLSREKAKKIRAWELLERAYKDNEVITGYITAKVKGGFTIRLDVVKAFLPGSLICFKPIVDIEILKGKEFKFKIIKLERKKNNIVVSQKFILEERNNRNLQVLLKDLNEGNVIKGIVKNITDYGVFIDLGGLDGLLHITDMSWKRVKHPSNLVKIGDNINVKILKFDRKMNRVSLGLKQLTNDPWKNVKNKYKTGMAICGKVTNITDYGCFVELEEGIEGLVHLSEMDWTNKNVNPNKKVKQGIEIKVSILDINVEKRRISLGLKQCVNNPWIHSAKIHKIGEKILGKVKSITDFGIFLELKSGINGLVHLSDISWKNLGGGVLKGYRRGNRVQVVILNMDIERERISLGIKQLMYDPFLHYISNFPKNSFVTCRVVRKLRKGFVAKLANNVEGFLKISNIKFQNELYRNINNLKKYIIKVKIISVDKKNKSIILASEYWGMKNKKNTL